MPSQLHKHRTYDEDELGSVTEYLCHDACHDLSIALAVRFSHDSILLIKDKDGFPVHSALYLGSIDSTIDGNGVATKESMIQDWSDRLGQPATASEVGVEDLALLSGIDEDSVSFVLGEFDLIAEFIISEVIGFGLDPTGP